MTGAPVPNGADAVVPFEDTDETSRSHSDNKSGEIGIRKPVEPWVNIRRAGEDIPANHIVLRKGQALKAADIGVLASLGIGTVKVVKRPLVAILATGNEVIELGQRLPPGCIYNSNSYSLAASVTAAGGVPLLLGIARDEKKSLISSIRKGLNADFIMTTGGVSLGDYDLVKEILATEGEISFWTVRMKPGKPLAFGSFRRRNGNPIPHLGFPGNPVSSMISFELFGRPAIRKMLGMKEYRRPVVKAVLESTIRNRDRRRVFARVRVTRRDGGYRAVVTGDQGSGILTSMSLANGLAVIPETADAALPGALVDVMLIESEGLVA
jgi:molybdopterin molybdotransferase